MRGADRIVAKLAHCQPDRERLVELRDRVVRGDAGWIEWSAVERNLQLALECAIDVGELVLASNGWERAEGTATCSASSASAGCSMGTSPSA